MTKDEALKLAHEALEANYQLINGTDTNGGLVYCIDGYYSDCFDEDPINEQTEKAITAIKEALAQEQEPVAWRFTGIAGLKRYMTQKQYDAQTPEIKKWYEPFKCKNCTTPPQRTWVELTENEIEELFQSAAGADEGTVFRFAAALQAKLKERNT